MANMSTTTPGEACSVGHWLRRLDEETRIKGRCESQNTDTSGCLCMYCREDAFPFNIARSVCEGIRIVISERFPRKLLF